MAEQNENTQTGISAESSTNNPLSRKLKKVLDTRLDNDKVDMVTSK